MNVYKTVEIPAQEATTKKKFVKTICDRCKKDIRESKTGGDYNDTEIEISMDIGDRYPEGGHGIKINIDLCADCFKGKLIPFLESEGVTINETKWDY